MQVETIKTALPTGTKREILDLLIHEELSAQQLAARLGVSPAAIRQHLATLQGGGLVVRGKGDPRPGRPTYVYALSPLARRAYPKRYDVLASELFEVLQDRHGEPAALELVATAARRVAGRARDRIPREDAGGRWDLLLGWLEETFSLEAEWELLDDGRRRIVVYHCPFQDIAADRPRVCGTFLTTLIGELLGTDRVSHVPLGDRLRCCAIDIGEPVRA
ncbi:MAG TPA: ArsR family transcriptional regulator [Gemmatimonadota bacterium]|nr:ArsR family transcriptional regulator [Gemmatimonadota bacterium]